MFNTYILSGAGNNRNIIATLEGGALMLEHHGRSFQPVIVVVSVMYLILLTTRKYLHRIPMKAQHARSES